LELFKLASHFQKKRALMSESFQEFKDKLNKLIAKALIEEALDLLEHQAKELRPGMLDRIAGFKHDYTLIREKEINGIESPSDIQREKNKLIDAMQKAAGILEARFKYRDEQQPQEVGAPSSRGFPKRRYGFILLVFVGIAVSFYFLIAGLGTRDAYPQECLEIKAQAQEVRGKLQEKSRANTDKYNELRYLFLENELTKHIDMTPCDSVELIKKDIQSAELLLESR
jgi:hypothetical protein